MSRRAAQVHHSLGLRPEDDDNTTGESAALAEPEDQGATTGARAALPRPEDNAATSSSSNSDSLSSVILSGAINPWRSAILDLARGILLTEVIQGVTEQRFLDEDQVARAFLALTCQTAQLKYIDSPNGWLKTVPGDLPSEEDPPKGEGVVFRANNQSVEANWRRLFPLTHPPDGRLSINRMIEDPAMDWAKFRQRFFPTHTSPYQIYYRRHALYSMRKSPKYPEIQKYETVDKRVELLQVMCDTLHIKDLCDQVSITPRCDASSDILTRDSD